MELKEASPGDVVNFSYRQPYAGTNQRYLAKVLRVRILSPDEIENIAAKSDYRRDDGEFVRTETLVTCTVPGGETRNFYAERTESCSKPKMGQVMYAIQDLISRATKW